MVNLIIWFWAMLCPNPNHTPENHGKCKLMHITTITPDGDTGGENGNPPPPPPPPPPHG